MTTIAALSHALGCAPPPSTGEDPHRTVVRERRSPGEDNLEGQRTVDASSPGFATVIELDRDRQSRPADALPEVIAKAPGATVRSLGGLGQFSAVSLRGSSGQQVSVFLDGVPIGSSVAGLVDLSRLPLENLTRIVVYRGHIPVSFGSATIGGAIDLRSAPASNTGGAWADAGAGSYGARQASASVAVPVTPDVAFSSSVAYAGATGNFPFYDTGGTPVTTADDQTTRRKGNHYDRVQALARFDGRRGHTRFGIQELVLWKRQGIPGTASSQASSSTLDTVVARTIASVRNPRFGRPGGQIQWVAGVGVTAQRFADPSGEVGVGIDDERTIMLDGYLSPRLRFALWRGGYGRLVADGRVEWVRVRDEASAQTSAARRSRLAAGVGVELEQFLFARRWQIVVAFRADAMRSRFAVPPGGGEQGDTGQDRASVGISPRVATRLKIVPGLQVRASLGRYFRPPTLMELFGDRGYIVGNEGLRPERGTAVDAGFVVDVQRPLATTYGQLSGFATRSEDLIQWIAAGPVTRPENIAAAVVGGLETSLAMQTTRRILEVQANYTLLYTEDRSENPTRRGQPLPGRPRHEAYGRVSPGYAWQAGRIELEPRLSYTVEYIAGTRLDPSGRYPLPARALQAIGAQLRIARRADLAVEVRNLLDVRTTMVTPRVDNASPIPVPISDFIGFPLPGRTVWASLRVQIWESS